MKQWFVWNKKQWLTLNTYDILIHLQLDMDGGREGTGNAIIGMRVSSWGFAPPWNLDATLSWQCFCFPEGKNNISDYIWRLKTFDPTYMYKLLLDGLQSF